MTDKGTEKNNVLAEYTASITSIYNKYTFVATASIFVSVLDIEPDNSFFGISVSNANERWIETAFFFGAMALAWNYLTKFADARKEISQVDKILEQARKRLDGSLMAFNDVYFSANDVFEKSAEKLEALLKQQLEAKETIKEEGMHKLISESKFIEVPENRFPSSAVNEALLHYAYYVERYLRPNDSEDVMQAIKGIKTATKAFESIDDQLSKLKTGSKTVIRLTGWYKVRYWSVDILFPLLLLIVAIQSYLFPNYTPNWAQWFGTASELNG